MPNQQHPQGPFTSVGTSMGLGKRHVPEEFMPLYTPGVGNYDIRKKASENNAPGWKIGTEQRKDIRRDNFPGPADTEVPSFTTAGPKISLNTNESRKFDKKDPVGAMRPDKTQIKLPTSAP